MRIRFGLNKTKKIPGHSLPGILTILQNQLKIFNLLFINHVLVRKNLEQGYINLKKNNILFKILLLRLTSFFIFSFLFLIFNDIFAPLLLEGLL
ncbi:MAG: hypothetical protein JWR54_3246 [Mucilaginibacter sp.]|nr:hypothetical protein [Mucilaginibacter sp.]